MTPWLSRPRTRAASFSRSVGVGLLLVGQRDLLVELGAQDRRVHLGQRLAGLHPVALVDIELGDPIAGEVRVDGDLVARDQDAGGDDAAGDRAHLDAHDAHRARGLRRGRRRLGGAGGEAHRQHGGARPLRYRRKPFHRAREAVSVVW